MTYEPGRFGPPEPDPHNTPQHDPYGTTGWRPNDPHYGPQPGPGYPPPMYQQAPATGPNPLYPPGVPAPPFGDQIPPPVPPAKKRRLGKGALVGLIVALVVICCGVGAIIAATNGSNTPTPTANNPPASGAPATTGAAAAQGPKAAVAAWANGGGTQLSHALAGDFGAIGTAAGNSDVPAMKTACQKLQTDTEAAQAYKQIPDDQAQQHWAKALAFDARAASDCIAGVDQGSSDLITKSGQEIDQADAEIKQVTARLNALAG